MKECEGTKGLRFKDQQERERVRMATKKAVGRIIHFANLPLRLLLPNSRENITEVAFKTVPSASKVRGFFHAVFSLCRLENLSAKVFEEFCRLRLIRFVSVVCLFEDNFSSH